MPSMGKKKNPHAVALGRLGGKKGGLARAAKLSPERLSEIGRKAMEARWSRLSPEERTKQTRNAVKAMLAKRAQKQKAKKKKT